MVIAERFVPSEALGLIERHRITRLNGVPTTYQLLMEDPAWATTDLSSLRSMSCGGSAVPARVREAYEARGLAFSSGYGLTETSPGATSLSPRYSVVKGASSGLPHFFTEVRLAPESGEVEVRGPNVFAGYWDDPEATHAAFTPDGWLRTGDLGRLDRSGFLTIVDRAKDLIISGGENVYPAEVELAIMTIPEVTGAAVIGLADRRWGEVPHAVLTLRPGATLDPAGSSSTCRDGSRATRCPGRSRWWTSCRAPPAARSRSTCSAGPTPNRAIGAPTPHSRAPDRAIGAPTTHLPTTPKRVSGGVDLQLLHPVPQRTLHGLDQALHDLLVRPVVHPHPLQVTQRLLHREDAVHLLVAEPVGRQPDGGRVTLGAVVGEQVDQLRRRGESALRGRVERRGVRDRHPLDVADGARGSHRPGLQPPLGPAPAKVPPGPGPTMMPIPIPIRTSATNPATASNMARLADPSPSTSH